MPHLVTGIETDVGTIYKEKKSCMICNINVLEREEHFVPTCSLDALTSVNFSGMSEFSTSEKF